MTEHILKLAPKNWQDFQHYKDRCPPWIKLHRDLLNNRDYMRLPTASKALAPLLWLLASESKEKNGAFNAETEELEFRLRMPAKDIENGLKALIHAGFFVIASKVLAECVQVATPERERETEGETEREKSRSATVVATPDGVSDVVWADFKKLRAAKKSPITQTAIDGIAREAQKAGLKLGVVLGMCCERGWVGFKAEWAHEKRSTSAETTYQRSMREKYEAVAPAVAARNPTRIDPNAFFDSLPAKPLEISHG